MPRPVGLPKTGGRRKGTPNRRTDELAELLASRGFDVSSRLIELLPQLPGSEQAKVLMDLMQYLYPKRKAVEQTFATTEDSTMEFRVYKRMREELRDLSEVELLNKVKGQVQDLEEALSSGELSSSRGLASAEVAITGAERRQPTRAGEREGDDSYPAREIQPRIAAL